MIFYALGIFSIITSIQCRAEELLLPVTTCKRNSINYTTCLKVALEESWPRFVEGLPEFDFPRLEPFFYKYGKVAVNRNGISGEFVAKNTTTFGLATTRFLDMKPHFLDDVFRLEIDAYTPRVFAHCSFTGDFNIFGVRASGTGQGNLTFIENRATWDITGHVKNDTWIIEHFQVTSMVDRLKIQIDGLFDGNKELTNLFETFINEQWAPIYRVAAPKLFEVLDPTFTDLTNRFFSKVSFLKVFP